MSVDKLYADIVSKHIVFSDLILPILDIDIFKLKGLFSSEGSLVR
jgi:hypothetical protein